VIRQDQRVGQIAMVIWAGSRGQQKKDPVGPARVPTGSSGNEGVECPRRRTAVAVDRSISRIAGSAVRCQLLSLVVKARSRDGQGHQTPVACDPLSNRPANHQSAFGDVAVFRVGGEFQRRWTSPRADHESQPMHVPCQSRRAPGHAESETGVPSENRAKSVRNQRVCGSRDRLPAKHAGRRDGV
jgi:hypothetical protein